VKVDDSTGKCTGWVVALAEKFPAAIKAAQALKIEVDPGPYGGVNTADLFAEYSQTTKNAAAGANWVLEGDVDKALSGAEKVLEMEYTTDMVCHATMEPLNATVQFIDGAWHVYTGTQGPSSARFALSAYLSKVLGQKPEDIKIYVHESILGGAFGGKQTYDAHEGNEPPDCRVLVRNAKQGGDVCDWCGFRFDMPARLRHLNSLNYPPQPKRYRLDPPRGKRPRSIPDRFSTCRTARSPS
jgi:hypothetical protein